jgi:hypothetical protein
MTAKTAFSQVVLIMASQLQRNTRLSNARKQAVGETTFRLVRNQTGGKARLKRSH